ncbi:MAG: ATP-binding protein, partial [Nitrososphaerales archaeon]
MRIVVRERSVLVSVSDGDSTEPTREKVDASSPRGRGLWIIEALADVWG